MADRGAGARAARATESTQRERLLGNFAPFTVVVLLGAWVGLLIIGFGLILYGLHPEILNERDFGTALYQSGHLAADDRLRRRARTRAC